MKLIYLFVKQWSSRNLSNEHYQLDSNDIFKVVENELTYKHEDVLPQLFWSCQTCCKADSIPNTIPGQIDSVSAIIGENGSGKTTFFTAIGACFELGRREPTYLCVCKNDRTFYVYTNMEDVQYDRVLQMLGNDNFKFLSEQEGWSPREPPFMMLYYSPFCCPYLVWNTLKNNMHDLSMTGFLSKINPENSDVVGQMDGSMRRTAFEFARIFAIEMGKCPDSEVPFPVPMYVKIGGTYSARLDGRALIVGMSRGVANPEVVWDEQLFADMAKMFCLEGIPDFRVSVLTDFAGMLIQAVQAEDKSLNSLWKNDAWKMFVSELNGIVDLILKTPVKHNSHDVAVPLQREWDAMDNDKRETICERIRKISQKLSSLKVGTVSTVFKGLFNLWAKIDNLYQFNDIQENDHSVFIPLSSPGGFGRFLSCYDCATKLSLKGDRIQFLIPGMSSGEMAYLYFWGRLYEAFAGQGVVARVGEAANNHGNVERVHALLLLDEVETAMHPMWQKQLVKSLVWFVETFTRDLSVHVIVSSHSPLLLSDIPKGNVVFLKKDESVPKGAHEKEKGEEKDKHGCAMENTFAANIFDLYKDSFFLDNGTMGEFAAGKVDKLLEKLNPKRKENETNEEFNKRTKIGVDDLKIAKLIGDPFLSRYVWRRLEELSKPVQDPENELIYLRNDDKESSEAES